MINVSVLTGSSGVFLLLLAFFLNLLRKLKVDSPAYLLLNFSGAGLSCYASYLIDYLPFVILEGTWALVALIALIRKAFSANPIRT